jgi:hypothetical protein
MKKYKEILEGWVNYFNQKEVTEDVAQKRATICSNCDFSVKSELINKLLPDKSIVEIQGYKCGKCNCPLSSKVRSLTTNCPENLWPDKNI